MGIPQIFHRVLAQGYEPGAVSQRWWDQFSTLHQDWNFVTWDDSKIDAEEWELGKLFASCGSGAQMADLVRLEVLWKHGGIYVDTDVQPIRSFAPILDHGFVVGTEDGEMITNAVIASEPNHPALRALMDRLLEWDELPRHLAPNETTGPHLFTRVLRGRDDVLVLPRPMFYPIAPDEVGADHHISRHALCVHHWEGTWRDDPTPMKRTSVSAMSLKASIRAAARDHVLPVIRKAASHIEEPAPQSLHGVPVGENRLLISTTDDFPIYAVADDGSITPELVVHGWYDDPLLNFIDRVIEPGDWFVDVGANIGLFTVAAARRAGRLGHVYAYEADPELAELINTNRSMNWLENVSVVASAAGSENGTIEFAQHPQFRGLSVAGSDEHGQRGVTTGYITSTVPVERLDERVPMGAAIRLVKIDVEGGESSVLEGMADLVDRGAVDYIALEVIRDNAGSRWQPLLEQLRYLERECGARFGRLRGDGTTVEIDLDTIELRERFSQVIVDLTGEHCDASSPAAA